MAGVMLLEVAWVTIGAVTAPHGVRGEVRVLPLTDFPKRFYDLERVFLFCGAEPARASRRECEIPHPGLVPPQTGGYRQPRSSREIAQV